MAKWAKPVSGSSEEALRIFHSPCPLTRGNFLSPGDVEGTLPDFTEAAQALTSPSGSLKGFRYVFSGPLLTEYFISASGVEEVRLTMPSPSRSMTGEWGTASPVRARFSRADEGASTNPRAVAPLNVWYLTSGRGPQEEPPSPIWKASRFTITLFFSGSLSRLLASLSSFGV